MIKGFNANPYIAKPMNLDQFSDAIRTLEHHRFQLVTLPPNRD